MRFNYLFDHLRSLCLIGSLLLLFSACSGTSIEKRLAEAQSALDTKRYADAYKILSETITDHPQSADAFTLLGKAALGAQDRKMATVYKRRISRLKKQSRKAAA